MDEGTILVYCCPSIFSLTSSHPSQTKCTVYTDNVCLRGGEGEGELCCVDHILQEFYTLFLTRCRTYQITSPPQTNDQWKRHKGVGVFKVPSSMGQPIFLLSLYVLYLSRWGVLFAEPPPPVCIVMRRTERSSVHLCIPSEESDHYTVYKKTWFNTTAYLCTRI